MSAITRQLADDLRPLPLALPAIALVGVLVAALTWAFDNTTYDTWAGVVVLIVLGIVSVPVVRAMARHEADPRIARLFGIALALKMVGALARFAVAFGLYDGAADAGQYHNAGRTLAPFFRNLDFSSELTGPTGTFFISQVTGWVYTVTGPTKLGAFFIFSWFGFLGLYGFYRAFTLALPEGDQWRYARLIFLLPSLIFWPSSLGKEAWMLLMLGIGAYGAARVYTSRRGGFVVLLLGAGALSLVRPHIAAILMVSAFVAYLLRRAPAGSSLLSPLAKLGGVLLLGACLLYAIAVAGDFFQLDDFNAEAVTGVLDSTRVQTSQGGSQFIQEDSTDLSPLEFPIAVTNVMFRPFPWEASNAQAVIAALEGSLLLLLFVTSWRRIVGSVRVALRRPYVLLCCMFSVAFIYGFSSFANFGILSRQRVQLFPFILVLVCLPAWRRDQGGWRTLVIEGSSDRHDAQPQGAAAP